MKRYSVILLSILIIASYSACSSAGGVSEGALFTDYSTDISARAAVGRLEEAFSGPLYEGDGGKDLRLAVLAPELQGGCCAFK